MELRFMAKIKFKNFNLEWKLCSMAKPTYFYKVNVYKSRGELFLSTYKKVNFGLVLGLLAGQFRVHE